MINTINIYQSKGHDQHHGQQLSTVEGVWQVVNLSRVLDVHDASRQLLATMGFIIKPALLGWLFSIWFQPKKTSAKKTGGFSSLRQHLLENRGPLNPVINPWPVHCIYPYISPFSDLGIYVDSPSVFPSHCRPITCSTRPRSWKVRERMGGGMVRVWSWWPCTMARWIHCMRISQRVWWLLWKSVRRKSMDAGFKPELEKAGATKKGRLGQQEFPQLRSP